MAEHEDLEPEEDGNEEEVSGEETTYEVTITQYGVEDPKPTEEDMRKALIYGLVRYGFTNLAAVHVEDKN